MGEKYPRWTYVVIFALLAIVVVLTARAVVRKKGGGVESAPAESAGNSTDKDLAAKDQQIEALTGEVARLRKDAEANSNRTRGLESKLEEIKKAYAAAQQKLKSAQKQSEKSYAATPSAKSAARNVEPPPAPAKEKTVARNAEPPPSSGRRPADPGTYEVIQDTAVLEKPSASAREVALLQKGMTVNVVGSQGDWLEVRSKRGNPPGFVRRDDTMFRQAQSESK
ncbi:MAG TPA: SH3 domain-containing protein [Candidatus Binatia bacterium]